jgi:phosphoribosylanthranilate isomerase
MTWVKICGNTNLEDARLAAELGADALGFVFAASKRHVNPAQVAEITRAIPAGVECVGVVESHDAGEIATLVQKAGLQGVQLHGGVDLRLLESVRGLVGDEISIIQTVHWTVGADNPEEFAAELREIAASNLVDRVLVDSRVGAASGGTGVVFDWKAVRKVLDDAPGELKVIVAGGLRPGNVEEAIRELNPWGVDVVSGVEDSPGHKDPAKLAAFLRVAKSAR